MKNSMNFKYPCLKRKEHHFRKTGVKDCNPTCTFINSLQLFVKKDIFSYEAVMPRARSIKHVSNYSS